MPDQGVPAPGEASDPARARILPCRVSVVVPVKNGGALFRHLAQHLAQQQARWGLEILILDSGSTDGSVAVAAGYGFRVVAIPPAQFGHGRTRTLGVTLAQGDVVCMLTHDVIPCTTDWPLVFAERLMADPGLAGVFGRQIPRDADTPEMHFIAVNYPREGLHYGPVPGGHIPEFGRVVFSDAFSALRRTVALMIPYLPDAPVSEDQLWARMVTAAGYAVAYDPRAEALHAHRYTWRALYARGYGVGRAGGATGLLAGTTTWEGLRLLGRELRYFLTQGHGHWVPWVLLYELVRWWGVQRGRRTPWWPADCPIVLRTPPASATIRHAAITADVVRVGAP